MSNEDQELLRAVREWRPPKALHPMAMTAFGVYFVQLADASADLFTSGCSSRASFRCARLISSALADRETPSTS